MNGHANWIWKACFGAAVTVLLVALLPVQAQPHLPLTGAVGAHDPATIVKEGGTYHTFVTSQGILGKSSTDLRNWTDGAPVFPAGPPAWTSNAVPGFTGSFWAPDVAYFNGRYHLYYSCSTFGSIDSAIGLVTTPSLNSPVWTDRGKVVQSDRACCTQPGTDTTAYNAIDPSILVDTNGTLWMAFGSFFSGIVVTQLDPATGQRLNTNSFVATVIANNAGGGSGSTIEAPFLYQRGGYYYLFVNYGRCCAGLDSTYNIRVGRSTSVTGPYLDRNGVSMANGGGTMFLESTARFLGPGHAGILDDNGTNWFSYHYYDGNANGAPKLALGRLHWSNDGWPLFTNDWSAFYTFNTSAREHLGLYNGTRQNNAVVTNDPVRGGVLHLDGVSNHVTLPVSVGNASTFAGWVNWQGGSAWQRIFDFGSNTTRYLYLTPAGASGRMRFAITTNGPAGEQAMEAPFPLPSNTWCHVAVTLDGARGILYFNGLPVATNNAVTIRPWQLPARNLYLGKSQWPADPHFSGQLDSFRIFGRALSATEVYEIARAHGDLAHRYRFNEQWNNNTWDSVGMAHGTLEGNATLTNGSLKLTGTPGGYVNLPGGLLDGSSTVTIEFWASFGTNGNWARVFDFGNIAGNFGQSFLFFSPHTGAGGTRIGFTSGGGNVNFDVPGVLDGQELHVVCIIDPAGNYAAIYTNGVLRGVRNGALPTFDTIGEQWSFLGRSLFSADAWLNATIDEFRIYDGRLTPQEITANFHSGPEGRAVTLMGAGSIWRFFDRTNDLGTAWRSNTFNDVSWSNGPARLGFGNDGEVTKVSSNRQWTTYFRRSFYVPNPTNVLSVEGRITRDDAAVIYLNGAEVWRDPNFPSGAITNQTPALAAIAGADETNWIAFALTPAQLGLLQPGWNLLAAEVHNQSLTSSDLGFDLELSGTALIGSRPMLRTTRALGSINLSWPIEPAYFRIYGTTNLFPPVEWRLLTNEPALSNSSWNVNVSAGSGVRFFRLALE